MSSPATTTTPITAALLRGCLDLETTADGVVPHRLPAHVRSRYPDPQLLLAESQPSGVRLAVRTSATWVELDVLPTRMSYLGLPPRPQGVYEALVDGRAAGRATADGGRTVLVDLSSGRTEVRDGPVVTLRFDLPGRGSVVEIWLPHNEATTLVALRSDAAVTPAPPTGRPVWLHHGSSISQGSNAATPTGTWPALAAARGGVDVVNLGFGGSALLDPFTARVLRDQPADVISLELGINVVNTDLMRRRAFGPAVHGFLDTVREGHPTAPLLVVSPLLCPIHERTPGPGAFDPEAFAAGRVELRASGDPAEVAAGRLTLEVVREVLARGGRRACSGRPAPGVPRRPRAVRRRRTPLRLPLPDHLHPDRETHRLVGERFAAIAFGTDGALAAGTRR